MEKLHREWHGGNVGLKELVREKGFDYIKKNFQYTIIEISMQKLMTIMYQNVSLIGKKFLGQESLVTTKIKNNSNKNFLET